MSTISTAPRQGSLLSPEGWYTTADWMLRVALFVYLAGLAVAIFTRAQTSIGGIALMYWGVPHDTIFFWERTAAAVLLLAGLSLLIWPTVIAALFIGGAVFTEAYAAYRFGGDHFVEWVIAARTLRYLLPVAAAALIISPRIVPHVRWKALASMWILRIGLAVVFATHGMEALRQHPGFIDLLIGTTGNLLGLRMTESTAVLLLKVIGVVDLIVAFLILVGRWRWLLGWLFFWAAITAASRMTALGFMSYPEFLVRSSHMVAPLGIWALGQYQDLTSTSTAEESASAGNPDEGTSGHALLRGQMDPAR